MVQPQVRQQEEEPELDERQAEIDLFNQAINDDPDIPAEDKPPVPADDDTPPEPSQGQDDEPPPAAAQGKPATAAKPPATPTGFEWLQDLPEDKRAQARSEEHTSELQSQS